TKQQVILKSGDKDKTICESDWLILQSGGWDSEKAVEDAVEMLLDALCRTLACHYMGADLGRRSPQRGFFFQEGLKWLKEKIGRPILNDIHGPMVFPTELRPKFARMASVTFLTVQDDRWKKTFSFALKSPAPLSDRERTAFDLFSAAHAVAQDSVDARFILLFAAIETLLEDRPRPEQVVNHVNQLIALTNNADLDKAEKDSLLGSLQWLRSHSIRSSGRRFVRKRLADRRYQDRSAEEVFLACYDLRNRLLHGEQPFPTRDEVSGLVGALEQMVSNLLAGPILDFDTA
ncbi:MAG TPA: hypothetical protein ACFYED_04540, partial [Candidatus Tripitaka californicus]